MTDAEFIAELEEAERTRIWSDALQAEFIRRASNGNAVIQNLLTPQVSARQKHRLKPGPKSGAGKERMEKVAQAAIYARRDVQGGLDGEVAAKRRAQEFGVENPKSVYRAAFERKDANMRALIRNFNAKPVN